MANTDSVNTLITKIRQRADQVNSQTFDDTTELKPWVRDSLAQLHEILVTRWADWHVVARPISLLANQASYSLPSDFRAMCDVWLLRSGGTYRERLEAADAGRFGIVDSGYADSPIMTYRVMGGQIYFTPTPSDDADNAIEIFYVPQYRAPLLDHSPICEILPNGWQEWVILDVLEKMNTKTRLMNSDDILRAKGQVQKRLLDGAAKRDGEAPQMIDVYAQRRAVDVPLSGPAYWVAP